MVKLKLCSVIFKVDNILGHSGETVWDEASNY